MRIGKLEIEVDFGKGDFRKHNRPWKWKHTGLIRHQRFYAVVLWHHIFSFNLCWYFDNSGYDLYDIELIPTDLGMANRVLPMWDTWKVKNEEELHRRVNEYTDDYYTVLRSIKRG